MHAVVRKLHVATDVGGLSRDQHQTGAVAHAHFRPQGRGWRPPREPHDEVLLHPSARTRVDARVGNDHVLSHAARVRIAWVVPVDLNLAVDEVNAESQLLDAVGGGAVVSVILACVLVRWCYSFPCVGGSARPGRGTRSAAERTPCSRRTG